MYLQSHTIEYGEGIFIGWKPLKAMFSWGIIKTYSLVVSSLYMTYGPFPYYIYGVFGSVGWGSSTTA